MRVLVIGSGGREHALTWKIAASDVVGALHAAPGSDAMQGLATCHPDVKATDLDAVIGMRVGTLLGGSQGAIGLLAEVS